MQTQDFFDEDDHMPCDCPRCDYNNGAMAIRGTILQFHCMVCGWWYEMQS